MDTSSKPAPASNSLLGSYFRFLRSPDLSAPPKTLSNAKIRNRILRLYSIHLLLILAAGIAIQSLGMQDSNVLQDVFEGSSALDLIAMAVIVAPVVEESIFRLPLRNFALNIGLSLSLVTYGLAVAQRLPDSLMAVLTTALIGCNLYFFMRRRQARVFHASYARYSGPIFYVLTLLFGVLHITNYDPGVWQLLPLLVLPQLLIGLWLGFVRIRYGFRWAVLAHGFHNGCLLLPFVLFKLFGSSGLQSSTSPDFEALSILDKLLTVGVGLYTVGGLMVCAIAAWKMLREWTQNS